MKRPKKPLLLATIWKIVFRKWREPNLSIPAHFSRPSRESFTNGVTRCLNNPRGFSMLCVQRPFFSQVRKSDRFQVAAASIDETPVVNQLCSDFWSFFPRICRVPAGFDTFVEAYHMLRKETEIGMILDMEGIPAILSGVAYCLTREDASMEGCLPRFFLHSEGGKSWREG